MAEQTAAEQARDAIARIDDGHRPHRFPLAALEADWLICWVCQACGVTVNESRPEEAGHCPIDWRAEP